MNDGNARQWSSRLGVVKGSEGRGELSTSSEADTIEQKARCFKKRFFSIFPAAPDNGSSLSRRTDI